jgi:hypothetical protein
LAVHDLLLVGFHGWILIWGASVYTGAGDSVAGLRLSAALFVTVTATVLLVRADLLPAGPLRGAWYRLALIGSLPVSYYGIACLARSADLRWFDQELWAIDRMLFGVTPAEWMVRLNRPDVIEWFAFFYQSYYYFLIAFLVVPPLADRGLRLQELMVAATVVSVFGHTGYTLVPGIGPYQVMEFSEPVRGGYWWAMVQETVRAEHALDIFPSMHTAMPTMFTLHLIRHRRRPPHRFLWPVMAFITANVIVATMLLRWHWAIDIVAGLALAAAGHVASVYVARRERGRGVADDRQVVWEPVFRWQRGAARPTAS